jgi:hypothetical protein
MALQDIIARIKQKKELSGIGDSLVSEALEKYLKSHKLSLENLGRHELKIVIKDIRAQMRDYVGRFQVSSKDRLKLLKEGDILSMLKTHSSSKERLSFYPELRKIISGLRVKSILDLGCGLNPLALAEQGIKYYASDINEEELKIIDLFFGENKIDGATFVCNLTKVEQCRLPEADICLILKVFDILGKNDYLIAEKVISRIKSKYLLISFSTKTLSGKPMNKPRRIWMEKLLASSGYSFKIINSDNEIFYLAEKIKL